MRAASIRFFEGRQPRLTQVPPRVRDSVITALLPSSAAFSAAAKAVEPEPRITRSNFSATWRPLLVVERGIRDIRAHDGAGKQLPGMIGHQLLGDAQERTYPIVCQAVVDAP